MRVFISYSHDDRETARVIADILRRLKIPFFLDDADIRWGERVDATISVAMGDTTHLVVLLSPASIKSQWVAYEVGQAKGRGVVVLPFLLHPKLEVPSFIVDLNYKTRMEEIEEYFAAAAATHETKDPNRSLRLAFIPKGESLAFWRLVRAGALEAALELQNVTVEWKDQFRESDSAGQNLAIEECMSSDYDGICVAAIHATETRRAIEKVMARGMPVVVFDSGLEDETNIVSYVATDNYTAGQRAGHKMAELLSNEGVVTVVRYKTGSRSTEERERGFLDVISAYPDIHVDDARQISDDQRVIRAVAEAVAARHGEGLGGVFCPIEFATEGMLDVIERFPASAAVKIVGFDANDRTVNAMRAGQISALILQDPFQIGEQALRVMVSYLRGGKVEREYQIPCAVVTRDNINAPGIQRMLAAL